MAVEKVGIENSSSMKQNVSTNLATLGTSAMGKTLVETVLSLTFRRLSGNFQLVKGQLEASDFEIFNVIGNKERIIGYWIKPEKVLSRHPKSDSSEAANSDVKRKLKQAGDTTDRPATKKLKQSYTASLASMLTVQRLQPVFTNIREIKMNGYNIGYQKDSFIKGFLMDNLRALQSQSSRFSIPPNQMANTPKSGESSHIDMTKLISEMSKLASPPFSFPSLPTSFNISSLFPIPMDRTNYLSWKSQFEDVLEMHGLAEVIKKTTDPPKVQEDGSVHPEFARDKLVLSWIKATSSSSIKILLIPCTTAYQAWNLLGKRLSPLAESKLKALVTIEDYKHALSKGTKNGGVAAIFDEIPYLKLFIAKNCSEYTMVGPTYKTDGFGFAFPRGSPLVSYMSRAILNVTQDKSKMDSIEEKSFGNNQTICDDQSAKKISDGRSLHVYSFGGLFIIAGVVSMFSLLMYMYRFLCSQWPTLRTTIHSENSFWWKMVELAKHFDKKDLTSHPFTQRTSRVHAMDTPDDETAIGGLRDANDMQNNSVVENNIDVNENESNDGNLLSGHTDSSIHVPNLSS
ncbi:PREDICTED: glutamate receptor 2.8-like [Prunus mume]|uniref:Glutamate receptor 2.8-like n=1 Tax=Prunus mume TaxID=102107 RepID=A0ABM1LIC1_PRUMU|nr:PREDICTED: glutamate receptor 2.8-like [Prunus mume]